MDSSIKDAKDYGWKVLTIGSAKQNDGSPEVSMERTIQPEFLTIAEAAAWMRISPNTLINWISQKKFGFDDGLRRFGGSTRIHFPTLRERILSAALTPRPRSNRGQLGASKRWENHRQRKAASAVLDGTDAISEMVGFSGSVPKN
jgi:Helix-turn-helix domain